MHAVQVGNSRIAVRGRDRRTLHIVVFAVRSRASWSTASPASSGRRVVADLVDADADRSEGDLALEAHIEMVRLGRLVGQ